MNRLGHGGGHYDRFLSRLGPGAVRIGIGYAEQVGEVAAEDVPASTHPFPLHNVLRPDEPRPSLSSGDVLHVSNAEHRAIMDALAERDTLMAKRNAYSALASAASIVHTVYSRSEVKFVSTVDVAEIQKRVDQLSKQHRELDTRIQQANWEAELLQ